MIPWFIADAWQSSHCSAGIMVPRRQYASQSFMVDIAKLIFHFVHMLANYLEKPWFFRFKANCKTKYESIYNKQIIWILSLRTKRKMLVIYIRCRKYLSHSVIADWSAFWSNASWLLRELRHDSKAVVFSSSLSVFWWLIPNSSQSELQNYKTGYSELVIRLKFKIL